MSIENEISHTVKNLPKDILSHPKKEIKQGYFSGMPAPLRIRNEGGEFKLTRKVEITYGDPSRVEETEMLIKQEEFNLLWPLRTRSISKTRVYYPLENNLTAEVDYYHGPLEGFITAEVEFKGDEERANFKTPDWFDADLSAEEWATNSVLSGMKLEDVKAKLTNNIQLTS